MVHKPSLKYTIGADPELFLINPKGKFRSAHNVIKGTKEVPYRVNDGYIQVDGVAAEFNIDPATTADEFSRNIRSVLYDLQQSVQAKSKLSLKVIPTAFFDPSYFKTLPSITKALGCQPDFNAYTGKPNESPSTKQPFRTGAGHVHIGWGDAITDDESHFFDCRQATMQMDAALYFTSLLWDKDNKRRALYGKIGAFRPKNYGVEYRSISNAWVADPDLHLFVFETARHALDLLDSRDIRLWDLFKVQGATDKALNNEEIPWAQAMGVYETMVDRHDFPELPVAYTRPF